MKGGVAMMLAAFMRAKAGGTAPPGDVIHAENERLPEGAVEFGTSAIERVLERF
ncbi:MAG TPA: hypothetical protein VK538_12400 [Solirubrobacteraceae bacterium]|nr:hypothetical protein [Solirubrobacteraceae bacterium]